VVVPVKSETPAKRKAARKPTSECFPLQSFRTLLTNLATMTKNRVQPKLGGVSVSFDKLTTATSLQKRAFDLLGGFTDIFRHVSGEGSHPDSPTDGGLLGGLRSRGGSSG
jgi:hypothetical protein